MKNIKRVACLVLMLVMVVSTVSVFAAFPDVPTTEVYEPAVSALNQLGIINGYEDGTFQPDNDVTRAEFTAMLMRTMGAGSVGSASAADLPFSDISDQDSSISWAIPNINTAYGNGIINGYEDGTFRPNDNVLYEEAVKMIVCALGYGNGISSDNTPWYSDFLAQARSLTILRTAQNLGSPESPASRACIAQMLYDSLEVPLVENNVVTTKTFLADYLGYVKNTGFISANDLTSLESPDVTLRENQIQIRAIEPGSSVYEVHTYTVADASEFEDKLGYQIDFFYPRNSSASAVRSLFSYEIKDNTTLELDTSMISDYETTNSVIRYHPDSSSALSSANLAADNIVIYNGKLYGSNSSSSRFDTSMLPNVGSVTLLDGDKDGRFETLTIWDYELYYVSSKSSSEYSIVDNATRNTDKTLVLDVDTDPNLEIVDKSGNTVSFSSIATGSVICMAYSNTANGGSDYKRAVVLTDKASGSVSSIITGEQITIGGTVYDYSPAAPWMPNGNDGTLAEPSTTDSGSFALDINGDVFAYSRDASSSTATRYGFILAYSQGNSTFASIDDFRLRVMTQDGSGTKIDYGIRRSTTINGATFDTVDDFVNELFETASYQKTGDYGNTGLQQVIKYTTSTYNGTPCIDAIYTVTASTDVSGGQTIETDRLYNYADLNRGNVRLTYTTGSSLRNTSENIQLSVGSAIVFVVPDQDQRSDLDSFRKTTASSYFSTSRAYDSIEAFDVSQTNSARVIVVYGGASGSEVDDSSPVWVLSESPSRSVNDAQNTTMYNVIGYPITRGSNSSVQPTENWVSTGSNNIIASAQAGDIYRTGTDGDGYLTFDSQYCLYPAAEGYVDTSASNPSNWNSADYTVIYGSVYASDSTEGIVVIPKLLSASDDYSSEEQYTISAGSISGAKILRYDTSGSRLEVIDVSSDSTAVLDGMSELIDGFNPTNVLVYMYQGRVKLLVVTN